MQFFLYKYDCYFSHQLLPPLLSFKKESKDKERQIINQDISAFRMEAAVIEQAAGSMLLPALESGKTMFNCLKRRYGYLRNLNKNFAKLEEEEKHLCDEEADLKIQLERNKQTKEKTRKCETWLSDVERMKEEIKKLKTDYKNTRKFLCGLCPFYSLLKLGKRIVQITGEMVSLKNEIGRIQVMVEKAPAAIIRRHAKKIAEFPSLTAHVELLQEYLRDDKVKTICIWGPPGVGKTTIMENLHDAAGKLFDIVFWVNVKPDGNIREVQETLLKQLNLKAEDQNNDQRADMISEELKNKNYAVFLDGVSAEINLERVGIHDEHTHGKVVFACRNRNIRWQTDVDIKIRRLSDEDAQKLFWEIVGIHLKDNPHLQPVARLIINECGGMPNMIKIIGCKLKNQDDPGVWRSCLKQLRSPSMEQIQELEEFYKAFKLVCDSLDDEKKLCLLYWAVFPTDYEVPRDYIIEFWRAADCFKHFKTLGEARDRGHDILDEFVKKSLLENGSNVAHYKMYQYFQRATLRIANCNENDFRILVKEGERIREEEWEIANRISLISSHQLSLPERPRCKIFTLLLRENSLAEIPGSFFSYTCDLQLLDLRDTNIKLLPSSISSLINLRALFLNNCCQLTQLPGEIGDLCKLEILDLCHSGIHSLPTEIGQLTNLKCLRVSFIENGANHNHVESRPMEMISSNVITRLHSLEELSIYVDPTSGRWIQNAKNIAREVAALEELTSLCFYFPTVEYLQTFVNRSISRHANNTSLGGNSLRSFSILVGYQRRIRSSHPIEFDDYKCSAEKHLRFSSGEGFPDAIVKIMKEACCLELIGNNASNISCFSADKLGGLEVCLIEDCYEMTSIIDGNLTGGVAFQRLNKLHIISLPKLVHIWNGPIESESLAMLTTLTLRGCHSVKTLFSEGMVKRLNQLLYLQVEDCQVIEEIIETGIIVESGAFPKLKNLQFINLPRLSDICNEVRLAWPSLETIMISACEALRTFPSIIENASRLKRIKCTQTWWNQLVWPTDNVRDRFQGLQEFISAN